MTHPAPDISGYRQYIEPALAYTGEAVTWDDIVEGVSAGTLQFWPGARSAIITEIAAPVRAPKRLQVLFAGGDLTDIESLAPAVEAWARAQGCRVLHLYGRPGWERSFLTRDAGWTKKLVVLEKEL